MALDRQSIEKRDFPIGRRGYEPAAVDSHLAKIAREVDALKRSQASAPPSSDDAPGGGSLASFASAQVQAIVEAAESSAAAIERDAREHAAQAAQDAARDAQRTRDDAIQRSQEHVGKVHEATALMLQRVDAMEGELNALVESLRTGANRLNADLSLLSGNMGELYAAAGQSARGTASAPVAEDVVFVQEAEVIAIVVEEPTPAPKPKPKPKPTPATKAKPNAPPARAPAGAGAGAEGGAEDADIEGARLIALNMALNGQSRTETDRYLAQNFDLSDRGALLDEVYATVEG